jgi:hypothetical protein
VLHGISLGIVLTLISYQLDGYPLQTCYYSVEGYTDGFPGDKDSRTLHLYYRELLEKNTALGYSNDGYASWSGISRYWSLVVKL